MVSHSFKIPKYKMDYRSWEEKEELEAQRKARKGVQTKLNTGDKFDT